MNSNTQDAAARVLAFAEQYAKMGQRHDSIQTVCNRDGELLDLRVSDLRAIAAPGAESAAPLRLSVRAEIVECWNNLPAHIRKHAAMTRLWEAVQRCDDALEDLCFHCKGSGESTYQAGRGPDTYEATCNCPKCGGTGAHAAPAAQPEAIPYLAERLKDHTCTRVDDAGGTPGFTLYLTKLGAHPEYQLYRQEAEALWINIGRALGKPEAPAVPAEDEPATWDHRAWRHELLHRIELWASLRADTGSAAAAWRAMHEHIDNAQIHWRAHAHLAAAPTAPAVEVPPMLTPEQVEEIIERPELWSFGRLRQTEFAHAIIAERDKQWIAASGVRS